MRHVKGSRIVTLIIIGLISLTAGAANADPDFAIPRNGFDCLMRNAASYMERGEIVYVKFDICPEPPDAMEELEIGEAENMFPSNETAFETEKPIFRSGLVLTRAEIACLRMNRSAILERSTADRVFVMPEACVE